MLTEIDIKRIMESKHHLAEALAEPVDYVLLEEVDDKFDIPDNQPSMYELQGAI